MNFRWNVTERVWEKNLHFSENDTLNLGWCLDKDVYVDVSMRILALNMGFGETPAHIRTLESDLKYVLAEIEEIRENGLVEHD